MAKERLAAIFIGAVMILSVAGFALNSAMTGFNNPTPEIKVPTIVTRPLTLEEVRYVLSYEGKIIIEYNYAENCTDCAEKTANLESFAQKMSEFLVLQEVKANETSVQIVGAGGKIVDITNMTLSEDNLLSSLCETAIAQPPECLMSEI